ncbi:MAG: carboxymuconolactone decarboxylase family protein [Actinomycetia bacterium]|nr:carboxymuconolactone decarboxylase family protein [Actinomycetes bacterium]
MPRIEPASQPYDPATASQLRKMMPEGIPPILLFRTFVRNLPMAEAMFGWGSYELSNRLSLSLRDREILIDRTCVRCKCEYEWGVHVAIFAEAAKLSPSQVSSLTHGSPDDPCWTDHRDRLLITAADQLHDDARLGDDLYADLTSTLSEAELLDLTMLCGWYHAISYAANGAQVDLEEYAPRFSDYLP